MMAKITYHVRERARQGEQEQ
jgi:hypothetical protein